MSLLLSNTDQKISISFLMLGVRQQFIDLNVMNVNVMLCFFLVKHYQTNPEVMIHFGTTSLILNLLSAAKTNICFM
jgi:hypothetical protein